MKTSLVDAQDEGEIFYRRKFNGTLRFIGDDFDLFYMVESVEPCTEMFLLIEQKDFRRRYLSHILGRAVLNNGWPV